MQVSSRTLLWFKNGSFQVMSNLFIDGVKSGLMKIYPGKWVAKSSREFTAEEKAEVSSAIVVASEYGKSVCFFLKSGMRGYIPVSTLSTLQEGQTVNLDDVKLVTLGREGDADILRVE